MATSQVETVGSGADKLKLAAAVVLLLAGLVAFYWLSKQGALVQWGALIAGLRTWLAQRGIRSVTELRGKVST